MEPTAQFTTADLLGKIGALSLEVEFLRSALRNHECPKCEKHHCDDCECCECEADGACCSKKEED